VAGISVAALAFGVVFAVKAEYDKPSDDYVTGVDGTYPDLVNQQDTAHREAILADVGFGVAAVGAVATVLLLARRRAPAPMAPTVGTVSFAASPAPGGGALLVQGSF
jgi:hypothetical protein